MDILFIVLYIGFLLIVILFFMFLLDHKIWLWKVKNYLMMCSDLEKEILKTLLKNPNISCPLTNNHVITMTLSNLDIIIKAKNMIINQANTQSHYYINIKIYKLVLKDKVLKQIYIIV